MSYRNTVKSNLALFLTVMGLTVLFWLVIKATLILYDRHHKQLIREVLIEVHRSLETEK